MSGHNDQRDLALYALTRLRGKTAQSSKSISRPAPIAAWSSSSFAATEPCLRCRPWGRNLPPACASVCWMPLRKKRPHQQHRAQNAQATASVRKPWWGWLSWAATAAVIVFAASLWKENADLKKNLLS